MTINNPLISVIIPTFNRYHETSRAIKSVFSQTYKNIEIIVVDDQSTNGSFEKLIEHYDSNVKIIRNKINSGAGSGRNHGVSECHGEFVAFLDSDDVWLPNKLEIQLNQYKQSLSDNALFYSPAKLGYMINDSYINPIRSVRDNEKIEEYIFCDAQDVQTSGWFLKKDFFNSIKFTELLPRHQDIDFVIRAQLHGCKFVMSPIALYSRGVGEKSMHVGVVKDDGLSIKWIKSVKHLITIRAYHYFIVKNILPIVVKRSPLEALKILFLAAIDGQFHLGKWKFTLLYLLSKKQ